MPDAIAQRPAPLFPIDVENAPKITLAGMDFPIPVLAIKQTRIVVPRLLRLSGMLDQLGKAIPKADDPNPDPQWFTKIKITEEDFDLLCDIVVAGIQRARPGFARGEFDQMPISLADLLNAIGTIAQQTGMMTSSGAPSGEANGAAGPKAETAAAPQEASPISTSS